MIRASLNGTELDTFRNDLEIITARAIEDNYYVQEELRRAMVISGLTALIGTGGCVATVDPSNFGPGAIGVTIGSIILGNIGGKIWNRISYPILGKGFANLSQEARNYDFTSAAMNSLKREAVEKLFERALVGMGEIDPEQCREINSINQASPLETIAVNAKPIHPYKSPFSTFEQSGGTRTSAFGEFDGWWAGLFGGPLWGNTEAESRGMYEGSGEIAGIRKNTPIEYLMEDANGNSFIVWAYHLPDAMKRRLTELSGTDLMHNEVFRINYANITSQKLDRLSSENAHLFYARALKLGELPFGERPPMRIYGQVVQKGDLPVVQLVGFENKSGQLVLTQRYPVARLVQGLHNELERIGYLEPSANLKSPDLLER